MTKRTPLVLYAVFLARRFSLSPPVLPEDRENIAVRKFIRYALRQISRQPEVHKSIKARAREIFWYLDAASSRPPQSPGAGEPRNRWRTSDFGAGSLKNILWGLRDGAGELYETCAFRLFSLILTNPRWPLGPGLREFVITDELLGTVLQSMESTSARMREQLQIEKIGPYHVAFNFSTANLISLAPNTVHLYAAWSSRGGALKALRGFPHHLLDKISLAVGGKWNAPYPDLRVIRDRPPISPSEFKRAVIGVLTGADNNLGDKRE